MNGLAPQQNHATRPRELALFAGVGGGILGGKLLNWRTVCAVEIDEYCRSVLMQRQDDGILEPFPIYDDITNFDGRPWRGCVDIVSGGFPCQNISAAGDGTGIDGVKSGLWRHMARVIGEVEPRNILVENSPLLTKRGIGRVLGDLAQMGYDARWGVLGGAAVGMCNARDRIWISAFNANEKRWDASQIQSEAFDSEKPCRRQFTRAIGSLISEDAHPRDLGDTAKLANWVERSSSIGNGQIPAVAALAYRLLSPR